jgi:hypothetical protein
MDQITLKYVCRASGFMTAVCLFGFIFRREAKKELYRKHGDKVPSLFISTRDIHK